jgi:hypothetical protein
MNYRVCKHGHTTPVGGDCLVCRDVWARNHRAKRKAKREAEGWVAPAKPTAQPRPDQKRKPFVPRIKVEEWTPFNQYGYARKRFYA